MRARRPPLRAALATAALLAGACVEHGLPGGPPRAVVLVAVEGARADRLPDPGGATPALARLAAEGVRFETVRSQAPWLVPAAASLFTGIYPHRHGAGVVAEADAPRAVRSPSSIRGFADRIPTLAEVLRERGLRTLGRAASPLYDQDAFARGFDEWAVAPGDAAAVVAWAAERLEGPAPLFLYLGLADPQGREGDEYTRALERVDAALSRLIDALESAGLLDRTLLVVTGTHGVEQGEHAALERAAYRAPGRPVGRGAGHALFEELLRVPLVVRGPGVAAGRVVATPVRLMDLGTTILEVVGPTKSGSYLGSGRSLVPALRGEELSPAPALATGIARGHELDALIDERGLKLVRADDPRDRDLLFDLAADPGETRDLAAERPDELERMRRALGQWESILEANAFEPGAPATRVTREALATLGYGADG